MNNAETLLSEEQLDFLTEMMSIGSGNAATALSQLLNCKVDVKTPKVYVVSQHEFYKLPFYTSLPATCLRMSLVGDFTGDMVFIINDYQRAYLTRLMEKSYLSPQEMRKQGVEGIPDWCDSILKEMANIFAGTYLGVVNRFCGLNIYHSIPSIKTGTAKSIMDETSDEDIIIAVWTNSFISETPADAIFLLRFSAEFKEKLGCAITEAMNRLGRKEGRINTLIV